MQEVLFMKRKILIMLMMTILLLSGCGNSDDLISNESTDDNFISNEAVGVLELPDNMMQTSMGSINISYTIVDNTIDIVGNLGDINSKYILLDFAETDEEKQAVEVINGAFNILSEIPSSNIDLTPNLFLGEAQYGNFDSIVYDFIKIEKKQDKWVFKSSPVLKENIAIYSKAKNPNEYVHYTEYIQSNNDEIVNLSNEITDGCQDDYDKVLKLHDWVAENIYYDFEAFYSGNYQNADSLSVLHSKKAVCEGYANLLAALVRAQNIPCRVQSGYALGIDTDKTWSKKALTTKDSNHAWNEAYVDGRWLIIDATWDSQNKIENGQMIKGKEINHIYFDSNINFFSLSHRSME